MQFAKAAKAAPAKVIYVVVLSIDVDTKNDQHRYFESRLQALEVFRTFIVSSEWDWEVADPIRDNQDTIVADYKTPFDESIISREDVDFMTFRRSTDYDNYSCFEVGFYRSRVILDD